MQTGREMYISAGCALENLLIAAEHFGYGYAIEYLPEGDKGAAASVRLSPGGLWRNRVTVHFLT
jgi:hypothetical protein